MNARDDPTAEADPDLRSEDPASAATDGPSTPASLDTGISYGRLVNVLAATTDRLSERGYTVTETQVRIVLQTLREEAPDGTDPENASYRLADLPDRIADVAGLDPNFVAGVVEDVVETRDRP